jgi:hypothetical protein
MRVNGSDGGPDAREGAPERDEETFLDPDEMADTYWHLVERDDVGTQPFEVHITNGPRNTEFI